MKFSSLALSGFLSAVLVEGRLHRKIPKRFHERTLQTPPMQVTFDTNVTDPSGDIPATNATQGENTTAPSDPPQGPLKIKIGAVDQVNSSPVSTSIQLWMDGINEAGGIQVGNATYPVEIITVEIDDDAEQAANATKKVVEEDKVLAVVGPNWSSLAIASGAVADEGKTTLISPWSADPRTTVDRPFVFRATFTTPLQGNVLAKFVANHFNYTKAAILYNEEDAYPSSLAGFFKQAWEDLHGPGSVVAEETFTSEPTTATKDLDFTPQLQSIADSDAEFLFLPQYVPEVATIVNKAQEMGWNRTIVGGDAWPGDEEGGLFAACGEACAGHYFAAAFIPEEATGSAKIFVDEFEEKYGSVPIDTAALTYDSIRLVENAVQRCDLEQGLTGDLASDRQCIRDALANTKDFPGVVGNYTFDEQGDPSKCINIAYMDTEGNMKLFEVVCP